MSTSRGVVNICSLQPPSLPQHSRHRHAAVGANISILLYSYAAAPPGCSSTPPGLVAQGTPSAHQVRQTDVTQTIEVRRDIDIPEGWQLGPGQPGRGEPP